MSNVWSLRNCLASLLVIAVAFAAVGCDWYFDRRPELDVSVKTISGNVGVIIPNINVFKAVFEVSVERGAVRTGETSTAPFNLAIDFGDGATEYRQEVTADAFTFVHNYKLQGEYVIRATACWIGRECYEGEARIMVKDQVDPRDSVCGQCYEENRFIQATLTGPARVEGNERGAKYVNFTITIFVKEPENGSYTKLDSLYIALSGDEEYLNVSDWHQVLLPDAVITQISTGRFYEFEATFKIRSFPGEGWVEALIEGPGFSKAAAIVLRKEVEVVAPEIRGYEPK